MHYDYVCNLMGEPMDDLDRGTYFDETTASQEQAEDGSGLMRITWEKSRLRSTTFFSTTSMLNLGAACSVTVPASASMAATSVL